MAPTGISMIALMMISTLFSSPVSGPPLPLDPAIAAAAPQSCIFYATSAGISEADPNSPNQTEQLFAEPEIKYFIATLQKEITTALHRNVGSRPSQKILANEVPQLIRAVLTSPFAIYLEDFEIIENSLNVKAGFLLNAGENSADLKKSIDQMVALMQTEGVPVGTVDGKNGEIWHSVRMSMEMPEIRWGWHGNYFIIGVGDGTTQTIIERMTGQTPAWLTKLRRDNPIKRESTLVNFHIEALLARFEPVMPGNREAFDKIGISSIQSLHSISGFDELSCTTVTQLITDGDQQGLFSLIPDKQLSAKDLKIIPADAMIAMAVRIDTAETLKKAIRFAEGFDPRASEEFEHGHRQFEKEIGVNIKEDLLGSIDDVWTLHMPGGNLMTAWLGSAATCKTKDSKRLATAIQKIVAAVQAKQRPGARRGVRIRESEFENHTLYTMTFLGEAVPFTPSWCVTDERLIVGLTPQTVRALITREQADLSRDESLAYSESFRSAFQAKTAPTAIFYCDSPELIRSAYPLIQMGTQILSSKLQSEGIDIDSSILPSVDSIVRHLRPHVSTFTNDRETLTFRSKHSFPGAGSLPMLVPVGLGKTLPRVLQARSLASGMQELNNLKQIALAFHIYTDTHKNFPTNIYDDNGKALLSWRVRLLPFLESNLDFHLDESWDSPHNLPLSKKMPAMFASHGEPVTDKTRFLALVGPSSIFPGNEEISFRHVTDGSSNTIMFVQAAPESAVPWSKPQDIDFDTKQPFRGIKSPQGQFIVAFTDGSVHKLPNTISEETMRRLALRDDGEIIDHGKEYK